MSSDLSVKPLPITPPRQEASEPQAAFTRDDYVLQIAIHALSVLRYLRVKGADIGLVRYATLSNLQNSNPSLYGKIRFVMNFADGHFNADQDKIAQLVKGFESPDYPEIVDSFLTALENHIEIGVENRSEIAVALKATPLS